VFVDVKRHLRVVRRPDFKSKKSLTPILKGKPVIFCSSFDLNKKQRRLTGARAHQQKECMSMKSPARTDQIMGQSRAGWSKSSSFSLTRSKQAYDLTEEVELLSGSLRWSYASHWGETARPKSCPLLRSDRKASMASERRCSRSVCPFIISELAYILVSPRRRGHRPCCCSRRSRFPCPAADTSVLISLRSTSLFAF
jgi:hypothetical protein